MTPTSQTTPPPPATCSGALNGECVAKEDILNRTMSILELVPPRFRRPLTLILRSEDAEYVSSYLQYIIHWKLYWHSKIKNKIRLNFFLIGTQGATISICQCGPYCRRNRMPMFQCNVISAFCLRDALLNIDL